MKIIAKTCLAGAIVLVASAGLLLPAKSKNVRDKTAGINGSFEISQSGLPVNWLFYTPQTSTPGDFDIVIDKNDFKDGTQSLKFVVRNCSGKAGRFSPGFSQEFPAVPGEIYTVSFWAKNNGCNFVAKAGGVNGFNSDYQTIVQSRENIESWRQFSTTITIPKSMKALRLELNILQPGTFWIDDIKIQRID